MSEGADPRIDAAVRRVEELADSAPEQHVAVYEEVHDTLQQVLADAGAPEERAARVAPEPDTGGDGDAGT